VLLVGCAGCLGFGGGAPLLNPHPQPVGAEGLERIVSAVGNAREASDIDDGFGTDLVCLEKFVRVRGSSS